MAEGMVGGEGMVSGGISNVGVLDLTGMKSTEELAGIESISRVGVVLVPGSFFRLTPRHVWKGFWLSGWRSRTLYGPDRTAPPGGSRDEKAGCRATRCGGVAPGPGARMVE